MPTTYDRILEEGFCLLAERGYNAVSFADLAKVVGIKKATVHHHFPTKEDLVARVMAKFTEEHTAALSRVRARHDLAADVLVAFLSGAEALVQQSRCCLWAVLNAEFVTLPDSVQVEVQKFMDQVCGILCEIFQQGLEDGSLAFKGRSEDHGHLFFATAKGAILATRSSKNVDLFRAMTRQLLAQYGTV
ncbi:MAG: TetR/AcrR family transcriptional regulator [Hyphomicrobiaceae bacterium]